MEFLLIDNLTKRFGKFNAVESVSITVSKGEFFCLLGPSGSGKTTLLRILAGFTRPDSGSIFLNGKDITGMPPHSRNMAMVFQNFSLWPHMTVFENIAYGLRIRREDSRSIKEKADRMLSLIKLGDSAEKYPQQLSGGQQQRIALARALIVEPEILLMDEPLSNLDRQLQFEMRQEIKSIQKTTGITTIYVTHDQKEGIFLGDRIGIMEKGEIVETGSPYVLYQNPQSIFTARFLGEMNFLKGRVLSIEDGYVLLETETGRFLSSCGAGFSKGDDVMLGFRPENLNIGEAGPNVITGTADSVEYLGDTVRLTVKSGAVTITGVFPGRTMTEISPGQTCEFSVREKDCLIFKLEKP